MLQKHPFKTADALLLSDKKGKFFPLLCTAVQLLHLYIQKLHHSLHMCRHSKIRTFRNMTQAELGAALGWGDKGANRCPLP